MSIKVSVVIPTKNAGQGFSKVVEAVLAQDAPWEYEVLVVDSGSTDGTVEFLQSVSSVRLHEISPVEFGHGKTRNLGASLTTGEYIVMITHDALPADSKWLYELVSAVEQSDDIAGAFGRHIAYERDGPLLSRDITAHFDGFKQYPVLALDDKARYASDQGYRQLLHFYSDNNACMRRAVWEKHPYPEVDFAEDQLWAKMIIEKGYSKAYADKAMVYHSHSFGIIELFQRSFDEARALKKLFGYKLCPTFFHMFVHAYYTTMRDLIYLKKMDVLNNRLQWMVGTPFRNIARQVGYFVGQNSNRLPRVLVERVSRDLSIQRK